MQRKQEYKLQMHGRTKSAKEITSNSVFLEQASKKLRKLMPKRWPGPGQPDQEKPGNHAKRLRLGSGSDREALMNTEQNQIYLLVGKLAVLNRVLGQEKGNQVEGYLEAIQRKYDSLN